MQVRKRVFRVRQKKNASPDCQLPVGLTFTLLYETPPPVVISTPLPDKTEAEFVWEAVQEWYVARGEPIPEEERAACVAEIAAEAERRAHPPPPPPPPPSKKKPVKKRTPKN